MIRKISLALLLTIIIGVTISTWDTVGQNLLSAGALAVSLNVLSMVTGYLLAKQFSLPEIQIRTITFEIGVQNLSLAVLIAITILGRPEFSILAVVYAVIMKVTALSLLFVWRRKDGIST